MRYVEGWIILLMSLSFSFTINSTSNPLIVIVIKGLNPDFYRFTNANNLFTISKYGVRASSLDLQPIQPIKNDQSFSDLLSNYPLSEFTARTTKSNNYYPIFMKDTFDVKIPYSNQTAWINWPKGTLSLYSIPSDNKYLMDETSNQIQLDIEKAILDLSKNKINSICVYVEHAHVIGQLFGDDSKEYRTVLERVDQNLIGLIRYLLFKQQLKANTIIIGSKGIQNVQTSIQLASSPLNADDVAAVYIKDKSNAYVIAVLGKESKVLSSLYINRCIQVVRVTYNGDLRSIKRSASTLAVKIKSKQPGEYVLRCLGINIIADATSKSSFVAHGPAFQEGVVIKNISQSDVEYLVAKMLRGEAVDKRESLAKIFLPLYREKLGKKYVATAVSKIHLKCGKKNATGIQGIVYIAEKKDRSTLFRVYLSNLESMRSAIYKFQVHESGETLKDGCNNTGAVMNKLLYRAKGGTKNTVLYVADSNGKSDITYKIHGKLLTGPNRIIGRSLVLHNILASGPKPRIVGCGTIVLSKEESVSSHLK